MTVQHSPIQQAKRLMGLFACWRGVHDWQQEPAKWIPDDSNDPDFCWDDLDAWDVRTESRCRRCRKLFSTLHRSVCPPSSCSQDGPQFSEGIEPNVVTWTVTDSGRAEF